MKRRRKTEKTEEKPNDQTENLQNNDINLDQLGLILSKANELSDLIQELDPVSER